MGTSPARVVTDSMLGLRMRDVDVWSDHVAVVLGQNPGVFTGPGTNTYLIGSSRRPLLLDTGQGQPAYLPFLARALDEIRGGSTLQEIVLTHGHPDHMGGVESIVDRFGPLRVSKMPWEGRRESLDFEAIGDGSEIATDGATLRAVWTPGHARDHLCFLLVEEHALFTGDVVLGAGTTVIPPDGDLGDYLDSLRRILQIDPAVIYPAHGPVVRTPREKVESYLAHRALREQQTIDGLRAGVHRVADLVRRIYTDVPEFLHAAAALSLEAHLRKLEKEAVAYRAGDEWFLH
jgi:ribonuclease/clavin/mitogillin